MKCLSIQQPWASLICSGIKDVENRSWRINNAPGKILIHAGKTMRGNEADMPIFFNIIMQNAMIEGSLPKWEDMPRGSIIGCADIVDFVDISDSIWAQEGPGAEWKWVIENARLFKEPIPYKGKQGLFEVPEIDENNLPESIDLLELRREGKTLFIPLAPDVYLNINDSDDMPIYITDSNSELLIDENVEPLPTDTVVFINAETKESQKFNVIEFFVEPEYEPDSDKIITYFDPEGQELDLYSAHIIYDPNI